MKAVTRFLRGCYESLVAAGWMWLGLPAAPPTPRPPVLLPPPLGHPERLCPDIPLTTTERALERQLAAPR
ncbi:DUF6059 family protein [Streptomyces ureilyticus]|uniref:Uncharacterized protein n=1 Tax=Streptomyces ureilyticus TaxID=1775131 RepID=A0ABX0DTV0_9ACTN|nr:DUF6059 family protein [Streptomyces ureilyticus]NGO43899.1 hypothetical protein [Streptomyces ureilyticus]